MRTGTKSLLFGVHQFLFHPMTVFLAWVWLYRRIPSWRESICIIIHDWGYWGKEKMDDQEGERHPETAARIAGALMGAEYHDLCLFHSRHYARNAGREPSLLCWADKLSIIFDPWWLYLPRAFASSELFEYREIAARTGFVSASSHHRDWYHFVRSRLERIGREKKGDIVPYSHPSRREVQG